MVRLEKYIGFWKSSGFHFIFKLLRNYFVIIRKFSKFNIVSPQHWSVLQLVYESQRTNSWLRSYWNDSPAPGNIYEKVVTQSTRLNTMIHPRIGFAITNNYRSWHQHHITRYGNMICIFFVTVWRCQIEVMRCEIDRWLIPRFALGGRGHPLHVLTSGPATHLLAQVHGALTFNNAVLRVLPFW